MKLITELVDSVYAKVITESTGKKHIIHGPFIHHSVQNRNGRLYSEDVTRKALAAYQPIIAAKRSVGELNHPESPRIDFKNASHLVTEMKFDGNHVLGKATILDTPNGKIIKALIDEGVGFGVSTRGLGTLTEMKGVKYVNDDYIIKAVDIVSDPSGPDCFVNGIMEGKDWVYVENVGWTEQYIDKAKKIINKTNQNDIERVALQIFENFIRKL